LALLSTFLFSSKVENGMSHRLFCDIGGHEWECDCVALHALAPDRYPVCICKECGLPLNEGEHSQCRIELLACYECKQQPDRVRENSEATAIAMPLDFEEKAERAFNQLESFGAVCFWCGYGYAEYNRKAEDEHFAYHCADAPEELRDNAKTRLLSADDEQTPQQ